MTEAEMNEIYGAGQQSTPYGITEEGEIDPQLAAYIAAENAKQDQFNATSQGDVYENGFWGKKQVASGFVGGSTPDPSLPYEPLPTETPTDSRVQYAASKPNYSTGGGGGNSRLDSAVSGAGLGASLGGAVGGLAAGAGAGAATGAAAGSVVPGIGTLIGAGVGAVAGGLMGGEEKSDSQRIQEDLLKHRQTAQHTLYGDHGSSSLAKGINTRMPFNPIGRLVVGGVASRVLNKEPLSKEDKQSLLIGGYDTATQASDRELYEYNQSLKRRRLARMVTAAAIPAVLLYG